MRWLNERHGLLLITGKPGSGKSTLMEYTVRQATEQQKSLANSVIVSHFFHGRGSDIQKKPIGLLKSLLHQILRAIPQLHSLFLPMFEDKIKTRGEH